MTNYRHKPPLVRLQYEIDSLKAEIARLKQVNEDLLSTVTSLVSASATPKNNTDCCICFGSTQHQNTITAHVSCFAMWKQIDHDNICPNCSSIIE